MRATLYLVFLVFGLSLITGTSHAAELQARTLDAWHNYVGSAHDRMHARLTPPAIFLWVDEDPGRTVRVKQGETEVVPLIKHGGLAVPDGLIHHWVGASFIPGASLDQVISVVTDYDRYKNYFNPEIVDSHLIEHAPEGDQFSIRLVNKILFVSAGVDTLCRVQSARVGSHRFYSISDSTRVQEIRNYGEPTQRELAPDHGDGFIWRLSSITRYEERDGGVYMEIEAIALTRDVPISLRFLVNPVMKKVSRNSLLVSLKQTRDAVSATAQASNRTVSLPQSDRSRTLQPGQSLSFVH